MSRFPFILIALVLCGPADAADYLPASTVQQQVQRLRSDVATLRSSLAASGANQRAVLAALAPSLQERARAASVSAGLFDLQIRAAEMAAAYKRLAAETRENIDNIEAQIKAIAAQIQTIAEAQRKLEEVARKIEELMPKISALVASDPGVRLGCTLPHASTTIVKGSCAIAACEKGWVDADGHTANGCEAPARN